MAHFFVLPPFSRRQWRYSLGFLATVLVGCNPAAPTAPVSSSPPAPSVGVVTVKKQAVALVDELPGRLEASRVAQIRARVTGVIQQRLFTEGAVVKAGQALFAIEAGPYQAAHDSATAALRKAEANLSQASALAERLRPLASAQAVSQQEWVNAQAGLQQAQADVGIAKAALQNAQINLGYATVSSPIAGRIGRAQVTEGALVGNNDPSPLAVVQQTDPLYINLTQSADEVLRLQRALANGQLKRLAAQAVGVRVLLPDGSEHPVRGKLLFTDWSVDSGTGQIGLRAEVPNPQHTLLPGLYVRVRLEQVSAPAALLLPQQAVNRTPQGDSVLVVNADGGFGPRPVKIDRQQQGQWVITEGLNDGEQVIVDGFQKLRGAKTVQTVPWSAPETPAPGTPPAPR